MTAAALGARRVCIVSPGPISCNPRVVKEADALAAAGYQVRVICTQYRDRHVEWDSTVVENRSWRLTALRWTSRGWRDRVLRYRTGLRQALFLRLARFVGFRAPIAELANGRLHGELLAAVCREPADLISAHYVPALPVACRAAERLRAAFAFDAEDDHVGEFSDAERGSLAARLVDHLQAKYLPRCSYVTAASAGIADTLAGAYGIARPTPIHNVFAWSERSQIDGLVKDRRGPGLSLYWFSQVVGLDRGLQDAIRAVGLLRGEVQLHIRGRLESDVRMILTGLAQEAGVADRVLFHPPVPPPELLSRTAEHDVGLALEQPVSRNRLQTCTNKIFFYLLAGLAVAATDTPGQRPILETMPEAGFLYLPGDYRALARQLQRFVENREQLSRARAAALAAARDCWNWERESGRLLALADTALSCTSR